jgi:hypothetical protein
MEVHTLPTALVTRSPERLPDIAIALKSAGFDILAAGARPNDTPEVEAELVDWTVLLVTEGPDRGASAAETADRDQATIRTLVAALADALAGQRPPEPLPWRHYATVDPDLAFADWRTSVLSLACS